MSQFLRKIFIITVIVCSFYSSTVGYFVRVLSNGDCLRPNGGRGVCMNLKECKPLFNLLVESNSLPQPWVVDLLKKSHCGFEGKDPVVCCPVSVRKKVNNKSLNLTVNNPIYAKFLNKSCGPIQESDKIFGGTETALHEFPWMARIGYETDSGLKFLCGGSLISHRYILTAAHCITRLSDVRPILVRLGAHDFKNSESSEYCDDCTAPAKDVNIEELIPHPDFIRRQNDIGLIRLAKTVEFQNHIRPICLPVTKEIRERRLENEEAIVTGWGITESGTDSPVLRKVKLPITSWNECSKKYRKEAIITESQICAGEIKDKDSCIGDSGGPLHLHGVNHLGEIAWIQYGIVSFGPKPCGIQRFPGVYTKVPYYMEWILENVKE